jgi:predicted DsbA family dithiol-disulfide isomerase
MLAALLAALLLTGAATPARAEAPALASGQAHRLEVEPADVHPTQGPAGAEVRIDVLLNLADPQVRQLLEVVRAVQTRLRDEVRVVYRLHGGRYAASPLPMRALWAAHLQERFFGLLDELLPGLQPAASTEAELERRARSLGLDLVRLRKDSSSAEVRQHIAADRRFAARFGLDSAVAGLVINGQPVSDLSPELVDEAVATAQREARELRAQGLPMARVHARLHDRHGSPEPTTTPPRRGPLASITTSTPRTSTAGDSTLALLGPLPQAERRVTISSRRRALYGLHLSMRRAGPDTSQAPRRGPARAKVKLVVFADFVSDDSVKLSTTLRRALGEFGGRVQLHFLHYPGYIQRSIAFRAAEVAAAAHAQGCFWGLHDRLYGARQKRGKLVDLPPDFVQGLEKLAQRSGCNARKLTAELASGAPKRRLYSDLAQARNVPLWRSPAVLVNGRPVGVPDLAMLRKVIREELKTR